MPNGADLPTLLLCSGKHCLKKKSSAYRSLEGAIVEADISFTTVACVGTCSGPTAMVCRGSTQRWFEDLGSSKAQRDLVSYAIRSSKKPSERLKKRELTGKKRKKVQKRLAAR